MKRIVLLSCFISSLVFAEGTVSTEKTKVVIPPDFLKEFFTITSVRISTLDGYVPTVDTGKKIVKLPAQRIDSLNYTVRVDSTDKNFITDVAKDDHGIKGILVCNNPSIRPLIMSKNAVVLVSVENKEGEPMFFTLYDSKSCMKK
ncbi:hypothetical protein M975_0380 [Buttiauxella brennerae ATCC 51605]|uniref:Uncharacterized protein n=1 Tax=Buttiauxella brennerae ATCC 51605 TaxID=1354251 RepID=A0A1B7IVA3_9ENTR|nr:hypothetical protein [Buttiauxella brennerae]OAT33845.1 hypothetical protein M975_0380 [Buttiauxella brennerae ATCC 51605]